MGKKCPLCLPQGAVEAAEGGGVAERLTFLSGLKPQPPRPLLTSSHGKPQLQGPMAQGIGQSLGQLHVSVLFPGSGGPSTPRPCCFLPSSSRGFHGQDLHALLQRGKLRPSRTDLPKVTPSATSARRPSPTLQITGVPRKAVWEAGPKCRLMGRKRRGCGYKPPRSLTPAGRAAGPPMKSRGGRGRALPLRGRGGACVNWRPGSAGWRLELLGPGKGSPRVPSRRQTPGFEGNGHLGAPELKTAG